ncbi:MAG: hypothetical protein F4X22_06490 [Gemmatimonadales bacterium]|nr:hypothetical protein [Candidatus Palauibacter denitrificans]
MSESNTDAAEPRTVVGEPGAAAGRRSHAEGHRVVDGIMITRWNLSLSLTLALAVVAGGFSILWERTTALHATQLELVTRVTRVEVQVEGLREDVTALREELHESVAALREEMAALRAEFREEMAALRAELREEMAALREELGGDIRERGDLTRAHETLEVGAQ